MGSHHIIEPNDIHRLHLNLVSPIYDFYHHRLKSDNSVKSREETKRYILSAHFTAFEDQIAAAEFLYMNDYFESLVDLLDSNSYHQEITDLYHIILKRKKTPLKEHDLGELKTLSFDHPSLHCLHLFLLAYAHYDIKNYAGMDNYTEDIQEAMLSLREPLFHYYMKLRFDEMTFHHYWKNNQVILAKKFAYKYINAGLAPRKQLTMHHNLALCHVFDDYDSSMYYAKATLDIAKKHNFEESIRMINNQTIPFIASFHRRTENITTDDPVEKAHLAIANGNTEEAIRSLNSLKVLTPFQESYLGLAKRDLGPLKHAKDRFINDHRDLFFAQLPEFYMKRLMNAL
ncbi:AimR family lysis-lysogeny pheromone receptor [Halobacillus mangrovi]|uniref:AimR family lysis-lysogeny pheromone receptor n=1 Tax=Halobacillus mangrovi TaxID=402384 RepID=UPI003D99B5D7